jgi:hypothetical protein
MTRFSALLLAVLLLWPTTASAETRKVSDPIGDNWTPGFDISHARYSNGSARISGAVKLEELRMRTRAEFLISTRDGYSKAYAVVVDRHDGATRARLFRVAIEGPGQRVRCAVNANWSPVKDRVRFSAPAKCLRMRKGVVRMRATVSRKGANVWSDQAPERRVPRG